MNPESCVVASYTVQETFKIPKGIDLYAPGVKWYVRWRVLHIETPDGQEYEIEGEEVENDYKTPDDVDVEDAYEWNVEYKPDEQTSEAKDSDEDSDTDTE